MHIPVHTFSSHPAILYLMYRLICGGGDPLSFIFGSSHYSFPSPYFRLLGKDGGGGETGYSSRPLPICRLFITLYKYEKQTRFHTWVHNIHIDHIGIYGTYLGHYRRVLYSRSLLHSFHSIPPFCTQFTNLRDRRGGEWSIPLTISHSEFFISSKLNCLLHVCCCMYICKFGSLNCMIKPEFFMRGKPIPFRMSGRLKSLNCMIRFEFFMS